MVRFPYNLIQLHDCIHIPANFFWDISVRFLSWECRDFWKRHDHFRRFPKKSEVFRRRPKSAEVCRRWARSQCFSLQKSEITRKVVSFIHFTHGFRSLLGSVLTYFLEIVSSKTATTHIFQSGVRNWPASVSRREIEVFNPQAWDSRLRRESWQVYIT